MIEPSITTHFDSARSFFRVVMIAPASMTTLVEDWRDQLWDLTVERAHAENLMPVGPVLIDDPEPVDEQPGAAPMPLTGLMTGAQMFMAGVLGVGGPAMCRIVAEVAIGAVTRGEDHGGEQPSL